MQPSSTSIHCSDIHREVQLLKTFLKLPTVLHVGYINANNKKQAAFLLTHKIKFNLSIPAVYHHTSNKLYLPKEEEWKSLKDLTLN